MLCRSTKKFILPFLLVAAALAEDSPSVPDTFVAPEISIPFIKVRHIGDSYVATDYVDAVTITIYDQSNCESGYRIYRDTGYSWPYTLLAQIVSTDPRTHDTIVFSDLSATPNYTYHYVVGAYRPGDSVFSYIYKVILRAPAKAKNSPGSNAEGNKLQVLYGSGRNNALILLPALSGKAAEIIVYDLAGRIVDRISGVRSSSLRWKPRQNSRGLFCICAIIDNKRYFSKLLIN